MSNRVVWRIILHMEHVSSAFRRKCVRIQNRKEQNEMKRKLHPYATDLPTHTSHM